MIVFQLVLLVYYCDTGVSVSYPSLPFYGSDDDVPPAAHPPQNG